MSAAEPLREWPWALKWESGRDYTWALGSSHHTITCLRSMKLQNSVTPMLSSSLALVQSHLVLLFSYPSILKWKHVHMPLYPGSMWLVFLFHNTSQPSASPWLSEETLDSELLNNVGAVEDTVNSGDGLISALCAMIWMNMSLLEAECYD